MNKKEYATWYNSLDFPEYEDDYVPKDGRLDDEEIFDGAMMSVLFGSSHAVAALQEINAAYPSESDTDSTEDLVSLVNFVDSHPVMKSMHQAYVAAQPSIVSQSTAASIGSPDNPLSHDEIGTLIHDGFQYIESLGNAAVNLFDMESEWTDVTVNDYLAFTAINTLATFPAFSSLQISPIQGGSANGTSGTDILIGRGNVLLTGSAGMDAFMVGWLGNITIADFTAEDKLILPGEFFGYDLNEVVGNLSAVNVDANGASFAFFGGAVTINLAGVQGISAEQIMLF